MSEQRATVVVVFALREGFSSSLQDRIDCCCLLNMKVVCDSCGKNIREVGRLFKIEQGSGKKKLMFCRVCRWEHKSRLRKHLG